jgi:hypothetical protein
VLYEPSGLFYVLEGHGLAWLCPSSPQIDASVSDNGRLRTGSDPTTAASSDKTTMYTTNEDRIISNQMQFVCRQLRNDTKGLGVSNTIKFSDSDTAIITQFMERLPSSLRYKNENLVYKANDLILAAVRLWSDLSKFYCDYTQFDLKLHNYSLLAAWPPVFFIWLLIYKYKVHNDPNYVQKLTSNIAEQQRLLALMDELTTAQASLVPPNPAIYSYDDVFDEDTFLKECQKYPGIRNRLMGTLPGGVDNLVAVAKECCTKGLLSCITAAKIWDLMNLKMGDLTLGL